MRSMISLLMGFFSALVLVVCANIDTKALAEAISSAMEVSYDNSNSSLQATNVQEALDELSTPTRVELTGKYCGDSLDINGWGSRIEVVFNNTTGTIKNFNTNWETVFNEVEEGKYATTELGGYLLLMEVEVISASYIKVTVFSQVFLVEPCE